jgi:putative hydrolase of the HAD superfamily
MITAVYFDAVGTVMLPRPSVVDVYRDTAARYGHDLPRDVVKARMLAAYAVQEQIDLANGWKTSEPREFERWQTVVFSTFSDTDQRANIFTELHAWFAKPEAWVPVPELAEVLSALQARGLTIGLASNYDARLRAIVQADPAWAAFRPQTIISSEIGTRKPALDFFKCVIENAGCPAEQILFVGDDAVNDREGARNAGMPVLHIVRDQPAAPGQSADLRGILHLLDAQPG